MKWIETASKGVRYREHPTRKHGVRKDRYFAIRYQKDGKRKEEGLGWSSEGWNVEKAVIELSKLKEAAQKGEGPTRLSEKREYAKKQRENEQAAKKKAEKEMITFGEYFNKTYLPTSSIGKKATSVQKDKEHFKNWIEPVIGNTPLKDIGPSAIEKIKKNLFDAGRAPRTIQYVFATIRQTWNMAKRDGLVMLDSPTKRVKIPKFDNRRIRFLSHEEATLVLKALKEKDSLIHDISLLSLHCGLRMGEIASLKWGHVDSDRGIIYIMDPKGVVGRCAYMTESVKNLFNGLHRKKHDDYVFTGIKGHPLHEAPKEYSRVIKELGLNDGVTDPRQKVYFHTLRHTFASWLVEAGTDLYTVKELLGHSVIAMTERYAHLGNSTLQNAVKVLPSFDVFPVEEIPS